MKDSNRFVAYTFGEGRTGIGQLVTFSFPSSSSKEEIEPRRIMIQRFLEENIRDIDIPVTKRVANVPHGGYGKYSRYKIIQHKYAGGGYGGNGGYMEVLEIKDPPNGRHGIVINCYLSTKGTTFAEWETLEQAIAAFENLGSIEINVKEIQKLPGFRRVVRCNQLTPWFYAIGNEELIGDFSFPEGMQDDPVYRFGRKFIVFDEDEIPAIKTCMGARFLKRRNDNYYSDREGEENYRRLVFWDDGSVWDEVYGSKPVPRPLKDGEEIWIEEAIHQFREFLAGRNKEFEIKFMDGNKFVGKLKQDKSNIMSEEGDYYVRILLKGENKQREGWVNDFKPSSEIPTILRYIEKKIKSLGREVERLEIVEKKVKKGGKKWAGVFFSY